MSPASSSSSGGSLIGALGATGATGMLALGDPKLTAALLQQGAHYEGHLALSQGAILTGLIWGAIVASVIDGKFRNAGGFAFAAFAMASVGIIHSATLALAGTHHRQPRLPDRRSLPVHLPDLPP